MSTHKTTAGHVVRWREGTANRQKTFDEWADAIRWDAETQRRKQNGTLAVLTAPTVTLDD